MNSVLAEKIQLARDLFKQFDDVCQYLPSLKSLLANRESEDEKQLSSLVSQLSTRQPINLKSVVKIVDKFVQENSKLNKAAADSGTLSCHVPVRDQIETDIKSLVEEINSLLKQEENLNRETIIYSKSLKIFNFKLSQFSQQEQTEFNQIKSKIFNKKTKEFVNLDSIAPSNKYYHLIKTFQEHTFYEKKQKDLALKHEMCITSFVNRLKLLDGLVNQFKFMHGDQIEATLKYFLQSEVTRGEKKIQILKSCIDDLFSVKRNAEAMQMNAQENLKKVSSVDSWENWRPKREEIIEKEFEIAIEYLDNHDFKKAVDHFEFVLKSEPNHFQALFNQGTAYFRLNEFTKALGLFEKAIRLNPKMAILYERKGDTLLSLGRADEAIEFYKKSVGLETTGYDICKKKITKLNKLLQESKTLFVLIFLKS